MIVSAPATIMTTDELLAMPNDGTKRWLIQGNLREMPMTVRNRWHSRIIIRIGYLLECWLIRQPEPRGAVLGGEAGCRLRRSPDSTVGVDVIYISPELAAKNPNDTTLIDGVPILAIEILSPNDTLEQITEKVTEYLDAGVLMVWLVNPYDHTVVVHRPGLAPEMFNQRQELSGDPHMPGLRVPVAEIFAP
ncbi:MAG: Uma2 family endonuclease [Planctomycetia bacterium]|nr:Uma2 family endonuclease [Planctomycetia bacterium]